MIKRRNRSIMYTLLAIGIGVLSTGLVLLFGHLG
jgi:hypothetical protein